MARIIFALLALFAASAYGRLAYQLPDGAEFILRQRSYTESFDCANRQYGFYADVDNNCEIFHVCLPIEDDVGDIIEYAQFSFVCGNQTVFDQATLSCNYEEESLPCADAPGFYDQINSEFGVVLK